MTVLGRLLERRNLNNPSLPLTSTALAEFLEGHKVLSGVSVDEKTAMRLIAVFRCTELIAGTCAALPLKAYRAGTRERVNAPILDEPHPEMTRFELWETAYTHLLLWGNAYLYKVRNGAGLIHELWPIAPSQVKVDRLPATASNPGGKVFAVTDAAGTRPYTSLDIMHIPGLGYDGRVGLSRIQHARQHLGLGMAAEEYAARFFGSGSLLSGILSTTANLTEPQADRLKARWKEKVGAGLETAHDIAVLDNGAAFSPVSVPPEDAQLLQTQNWSAGQVAMLFGLPPHAIGQVEKSTSWGTGIEQQKIGMVQFTLDPTYLTRVEQRVTKEVLLNPRVYAEYTREGLLRGDSAARSAFYTAMRQIRAMSANEVRGLENMEPYEGGDEYDNPNIDVGAAGDEDTSARGLVEMVQKVYLGVGTVLSVDEARQILNRAGAGLAIPAPDLNADAGGAGAEEDDDE